jgi:recombinational DNA repair protein RecR
MGHIHTCRQNTHAFKKLCTFENFKNIVGVKRQRGHAGRWHMLYSTLRKQRQADLFKFKASQVCMMRPCHREEKKGREGGERSTHEA